MIYYCLVTTLSVSTFSVLGAVPDSDPPQPNEPLYDTSTPLPEPGGAFYPRPEHWSASASTVNLDTLKPAISGPSNSTDQLRIAGGFVSGVEIPEPGGVFYPPNIDLAVPTIWEGMDPGEPGGAFGRVMPVVSHVGSRQLSPTAATQPRSNHKTPRVKPRKPPTTESLALNHLNMANMYQRSKLYDQARREYNVVIESYPETEAAKEAGKLIEELPQ